MSGTTSTAPGPDLAPETIEASIAATRVRLAARLDALVAKVDVKARAQDKVEDVKLVAQARTEEGKEKVLASSREVSDRYQDLSVPARVAVAVGPVVLMLVLVIRKIRS